MLLRISYRTIGSICLSVFAYKLLYTVLKYGIVKPYLRRRIVLKKLGKWAVVTMNAGDYLGKEYAYALAKEGLCIILIGKEIHNLKYFVAEIESLFGVRALLVDVDLIALGSHPEELLRRVRPTLQGHEVGVFVSCASACARPGRLGALSGAAAGGVVSCNVGAMTTLLGAVLSGMARRRRGLVLLVASTAALLPCPLLAVYAASQAYVHKLAHDLALECAPLGIVVTAHTPGVIDAAGRGSWFVPSARRYVEASLAAVGTSTCTPAYTPHCLLMWLAQLVLRAAPDATQRAILRAMEALRRQDE